MRHKFYIILLILLATLNTKSKAQSCWQNLGISCYTYTNSTIGNNGTLWLWGFGPIGNNTNINIPTQIGTQNNWLSIATTWESTLGLKSDGTLWSWGYNLAGELGDGTNNNRLVPGRIGNDTDWREIDCGRYFCVSIKKNGTLWYWGATPGTTGSGGTSVNIPTQVGTDTNWSKVSCGGGFILALKKNGSLWAWGQNNNGQLGDGTVSNRISPNQIGTDTTWLFIEAGGTHSLALKKDRTLWAWGGNYFGQLGDGSLIDKGTPTQIGNANNWQSISGGGTHTLALKTDGTLWAWGNNTNGQLGIGNKTTQLAPVQVGNNNDWQQIHSIFNASTALKLNGSLMSWGDNSMGQLGNGSSNLDTSILVGITCPTNLPIKLVSFTTHKEKNSILYNWETSNEIGVSHFNIQISSNGSDFKNIATIQAAGGGTYRFTSDCPLYNTIYSRLEIIEKNGSKSYSNMTMLNQYQLNSISSFYPNPAHNVLNVSIDNLTGKGTIVISNLLGQQVVKQNLSLGINSVNTSTLSKGVYISTIMVNNIVKTEKVIIE